jgi:hypothetical protein
MISMAAAPLPGRGLLGRYQPGALIGDVGAGALFEPRRRVRENLQLSNEEREEGHG